MIRFTLRIYDSELYNKLVSESEKNERSLNSEIIIAIKKHLGL
jgi:hypothetical protein